jgi:superfamily II DNA/RNA helicase
MLGQGARERNLRKFRSGQADVVVATDVAARGIHVDNVSLVVHYDAPTERKAYVHRSGRTARAGHPGTVVTMTTTRQLASVTRMQRAAGVVAVHHDVRTEPQPMTAESLARSGSSTATSAPRPSAAAAAHAPAEHRRREPAPRRSGDASRRAPRAGTRRPTAGARRPEPTDTRRRTDPAAGTSRVPTRARSVRGSTGRTRKPRWTAAQRRAGTKR